jgi:hypothetical protein
VSLAPLLLERSALLDLSALDGETAARTALCALPWLVAAGLPRHDRAPFCARSWWSGCMVCLPVLALAMALDLEAGAPAALAAKTSVVLLVMIGLSALAADIARSKPAARRVHAALWIGGCAGLPLLAASLRSGPQMEKPLPEWLERLAGASPLDWAWHAAHATPAPWAALIAALALAGLSAALAREPQL